LRLKASGPRHLRDPGGIPAAELTGHTIVEIDEAAPSGSLNTSQVRPRVPYGLAHVGVADLV
jgi:hypothetical protein